MQSSEKLTKLKKHYYVRIAWLPRLAGTKVKFGQVPAVSAPFRRQTDRRSYPPRRAKSGLPATPGGSERSQHQRWPEPVRHCRAADRDDAWRWYDVAALGTYLSLGSQKSEAS